MPLAVLILLIILLYGGLRLDGFLIVIGSTFLIAILTPFFRAILHHYFPHKFPAPFKPEE